MFERLKQLNDQIIQQEGEKAKEAAQSLQMLDLRRDIVTSFQSLVDYMERRVSKTHVVNQLREIGTPDALVVAQAVQDLHRSFKERPDLDLTEVISVIKDGLDGLKTSIENIPETQIPENIDYSTQFGSLNSAMQAVVDAIKAQEVTVEAPTVNVESPNVQVDAPDLKPLAKELEKAFKQAIGLIDIPKTDFTPVVEEQKKTTKAVEKLNKTLEEMPVGGGGGGSTSIAPFLDAQGRLPVTMSAGVDPKDFYVNDQEPGTTEYYGKTHYSTGDWLIVKVTETSLSYATVTNNVAVTSYTDAWTDRATLTYGRIDEAF